MTPALLALALVLQEPDTSGPGRPCVVVIDYIRGLYRRIPVAPDVENHFGSGGVLAHCRGTTSQLSADSIAWYPLLRRFDMVGNVRIRDASFTLDSRTASYFLGDERLEAYTDVVAVNRRSGSVLRGPNLTYLRATQGIRDTSEMRASGRPTIEYRARPDTTLEPYLIVADRVRMAGDDRVWAGGRVEIDRSDFAARGDSLDLDQTAGRGHLVGREPPTLSGKGDRPYTLLGSRIDLGLEERELRRVMALGAGRATGSDWRLTADTILLTLERQRLQQAFAWGREDRPEAVSSQQTIVADSLAMDVPDEVLTEIRAFGRALSTARRDTTAAADVDWIGGDTLTAAFAQEPDSTGRARTELRRVVARGSARALTHIYDEARAELGPSINYSRGDAIDIVIRARRIDRVTVSGESDGVHLEPRPIRTVPADTASTSEEQP